VPRKGRRIHLLLTHQLDVVKLQLGRLPLLLVVKQGYSGDVNEDHQPHGQGKIKYKDGTTCSGVWSEGSLVHGKRSKALSSGKKKVNGRVESVKLRAGARRW
jgi:hypothetical protein